MPTPRPLCVLFVMDNPGYLRYFDGAIARLAHTGHRVSLAFNDPSWRADALATVADQPGVTVLGQAPPRRDRYAVVARRLRMAMDYTRYLDPRFARAEYYRNKRRVKAIGAGVRAGGGLSLRTVREPWVRAFLKLFGALEGAVPSSREVEEFIARAAPDVVLVTPLVLDASPQTDYVKSARALGIPSGLCVASWDNLTNKGLMRVVPDSVIVWNETQRREAVELHGVDPAQVTVTGAQNFDRWFGRRPSILPDEFCAKVGLPSARPFVLYVGSTSNIARAGVEEDFVRRWLEAMRESADVAELPVLVRPHPERPGLWYDGEVGPGPVRLWPPDAPEDLSNVTEESRRDYFDSLYHCAAVVGINTSAMLEAAILGNPVLTVREPELAQAHEGTLHFDYLLPENGGFLHVADDLDEHVRQLAEALRSPENSRRVDEAFVARFVRPHGLDRAATPLLAGAVERLAASRPRVSETAAPVRHALRATVWLYAALEEVRRSGTRPLAGGPLRSLARRVRPRWKLAGRVLKRAAGALEAGGAPRGERRRQLRRRRLEAREFGRRLLDPEGRSDPSASDRYRDRDLSD